jgi:multisubunit Na+/H+ antiporter MnhE subunit
LSNYSKLILSIHLSNYSKLIFSIHLSNYSKLILSIHLSYPLPFLGQEKSGIRRYLWRLRFIISYICIFLC